MGVDKQNPKKRYLYKIFKHVSAAHWDVIPCGTQEPLESVRLI